MESPAQVQKPVLVEAQAEAEEYGRDDEQMEVKSHDETQAQARTRTRAPATPTVAVRYGKYLADTPLCTRKEMCERFPNQCEIVRITKGDSSVYVKTIAERFTKYRRAPLMKTSDAQPVTFDTEVPPVFNWDYRPDAERDYVVQTFKIIEVLGCGSFGIVLKVLSKDKLELAIKYSRKYHNQRSRYEKYREVVFLQFINHPNCIRFQSAWEEADSLFIQTEMCDRSLLYHIYDVNGSIPEKGVWNVLVDVLRAVAYLHEHSILHLDIKPDNILLTSGGVAKLGDFGLCFHLKSDNAELCIVEGDARYLPLEAFDDNSEYRVSTKRDIYSLGLCALQMATDLWIPQSGEQLSLVRHLRIPDRLTNHVAPRLLKVVYQMMATNPQERPEAHELLLSKGLSSIAARRRRLVESQRLNFKADYSQQYGPDWVEESLKEARRRTLLSRRSMCREGVPPKRLEF